MLCVTGGKQCGFKSLILPFAIRLQRQQASRFIMRPQQGLDLLTQLSILTASDSQKR
jgi:hypothetical protein